MGGLVAFSENDKLAGASLSGLLESAEELAAVLRNSQYMVPVVRA